MSEFMSVQCKAAGFLSNLLLRKCRPGEGRDLEQRTAAIQTIDSKHKVQKNLSHHIPPERAGLYGLVIIARCAPPVPISNTNVKTLCADGTMS